MSYFEWVQNKAGFYWPLDKVRERLHETMAREFNAIYAIASEKETDMRTAAYAHGLNRLGQAIAAKGTESFFNKRGS